ncbi:tryptase-like [Arapaima gigas]
MLTHASTNRLYFTSLLPATSQFRSKIIGGKGVTINDFNWMAAVVQKSSPSTLVCGAIFLKNRWLLSAAHCFRYQGSYIVRIGVRRLHDNSLKQDMYNISKIIVHPLYKRKEDGDDLALIKVDRKIKEYNLVSPIPELDNGQFTWSSDSPCAVAGWGNTKEKESLNMYMPLQEVNVPIVNIHTCRSKYASIGVNITWNMMCAGKPGQEVCVGDSGGSLVCNRGSNWYLVGVVSFGRRCGVTGFPSVYTKVSNYRKFIDDTIRRY